MAVGMSKRVFPTHSGCVWLHPMNGGPEPNLKGKSEPGVVMHAGGCDDRVKEQEFKAWVTKEEVS